MAFPIFHLLYFVALFLFTMYSWMLGYHWFTYGSDRKVSRLTLVMYLSVGAVLLLLMSILLFWTM